MDLLLGFRFIILIRICLFGQGLGRARAMGFLFIISINGRGVTHYNRQCIGLLRGFIERLYIMAHINTTLINKPTLGQIHHCLSFYKNNCNNICIFQKKVVPLQ